MFCTILLYTIILDLSIIILDIFFICAKIKTMDIVNDELLKLDNEVGFALYACSKGLIRKYNPVLERLGLTYTSYLVMLALWEQDGVSVSELGKKLYLDSGTLTPLLKKMEKQGLLLRRRDEEDERVVLIALTPKGRGLQAKTERTVAALNNTLRLLRESSLFSDLKRLLGELYEI